MRGYSSLPKGSMTIILLASCASGVRIPSEAELMEMYS